jgi:hypothetical protein
MERFIRGLLAIGSALACIVVASTTAGASVQTHARILCGVERWTVKTLQDRPRLLPTKNVTLR